MGLEHGGAPLPGDVCVHVATVWEDERERARVKTRVRLGLGPNWTGRDYWASFLLFFCFPNKKYQRRKGEERKC